MRFNTSINNVKCLEWGINANQGALFDLLYQASSWANTVILDNEVYYHVSRNLVIEELPLYYNKPDTVYRSFGDLHDRGLIVYRKDGKKDLMKLTEKGKEWNKKLGNKSEKKPKFGNESEKTRNEIRKNSDSNPTNNNINNNNINNNKKILSNDNIQKVQEEWNILANELNLPKIDKIDGKRLSNLNARIKKYGIEKFLGVMQKIRKSKFLKGEVNDFRATFDFLVTASSFEKIKDGNYESKENKKIDPNTDRMRRLTEVVRKRNNAGAIDNSE